MIRQICKSDRLWYYLEMQLVLLITIHSFVHALNNGDFYNIVINPKQVNLHHKTLNKPKLCQMNVLDFDCYSIKHPPKVIKIIAKGNKSFNLAG